MAQMCTHGLGTQTASHKRKCHNCKHSHILVHKVLPDLVAFQLPVTSILTSPVDSCMLHWLNQLPSQAGVYVGRKEARSGWRRSRQLVPGIWRFRHQILVKNKLYSVFAAAVVPSRKMTESRDHHSSSLEPPSKFPKCSHFRRHSDNHEKCQQCRFNDCGHECTRETPYEVCKTWISENWDMHEKACKQKLKRNCSDELSLHPRDLSRSSQPGPKELPEHHWWTLARTRGRTGCHGLTILHC